MIVLTVKTLDSQNHSFTVDDDITVGEFKAKIADTVKIAPETQRIIYCGRVLQDDVKLNDYDVHGKVVHLVQRPPPGANPPTTRSPSPQPPRRGFRGFEPGNTMYLGSMAFPSNLMESQGIVPPPPTHSLAGSRLNVARRMLRRADAVISLLENPSARPGEQAAAEEPPEEEVTPIIEARVIVPPGNNEPIDEQMVLSAVQNTLFDAASSGLPMPAEVTVHGAVAAQSTSETSSGERSASSTPEEGMPPTAESSTDGPSSSTSPPDQRNGASARSIAENASRTSEMADLLTMLNQLQLRFAPFLERYRQFMADDPVVTPENVRQTQAMLSRVSEVLHFLGHAYHSLSDIIIRVRTPPPRPLLCRPILIQHSAVVQAGIPIQVEVAQFNLSAERPSASAPTTGAATEPTSTPTASSIPNTTTTTTTSGPATEATPTTPPRMQQGQPTVNFRSFPFIPSMRVQSFPIEVRASAAPRPVNGSVGPRPQNNNNNTVGGGGGADGANAPASGAAPVSSATTSSANAAGQESTFNMPNFNNSSVEFFMEVSPEVLQGTINGPPPEFLQSLVQMAGQIMNRVTTTTANPTSTTADAPATSGTNAASSTDASQPNVTSQGGAGQNSQARGNTQTNPTTVTHTRSTPRPHVHLAQQAMQGGFDPFLPCNSHHVTHRRRNQQSNGSQNGTSARQQQAQQQSPQQQQQARPQQSRPQQRITPWDLQTFISNLPPNMRSQPVDQLRMSQQQLAGEADSERRNDMATNILDNFFNSFRTAYRRRSGGNGNGGLAAAARNLAQSAPADSRTSARPSGASSDGSEAANAGAEDRPLAEAMPTGSGAPRAADADSNRAQYPSFAAFLPNLQSTLADLPNMLQGPTIADILQQLPPEEAAYRPGESIITDLIMLLSRNLTIVDMITLNTGNFEPLNRVIGEMQTFFMTRVLDGSTSPESINAGVDRVIEEMQPFFQNFSQLRVRDDIDMVRSVEQLFLRRLPDIITTAANVNAQTMRDLVNQCVTLLKMMITLTLNASLHGQQGVEETFQQIILSYMQGIPEELQNWTVMTSRSNLRHVINNLGVSESDVEQYIVRTSDISMATESERTQATENPAPATESEPMELDEPEMTNDTSEVELTSPPPVPPPVKIEDPEPLPNIVLGSESWHGQVPEDWVPIITRDVQRQRRQIPQEPFSDAYLSGMPTKRRKIVASAKPQGSLPQVISDSVRRAVTATGLQSAAPLETVSQGAGGSGDVQTAYRSLLRTTVQSSLRDNEDFSPERFPNAATYFNSQ